MAERIVHSSSLASLRERSGFIVHRDTNLTDLTDSTDSQTIPTHRPYRLTDTLTHRLTDSPISYDCQFDINSYSRLSKLEGKIPPAEYAQAFLNWHRGTLINLETNLGERFNAELFEFKYPRIAGRLQHPFKDEPFLDSIVSGQQHRLGSDISLNHNQQRELAEVVSFSAVESYFANYQETNRHSRVNENPDSRFPFQSQGKREDDKRVSEDDAVIGTEKLINPSPPGGDYGANFIDVFDRIQEDDMDFVRIRRFAVSTNPEDHWKIAQDLSNSQLPENIPAGEQHIKLKETVIRTSLSDSEILSLYLPDKSALSLADYEHLKKEYRPWTGKYIEAIVNNAPLNQAESLLKDSLIFADCRLGKAIDKSGTVTTTSVHIPGDIPYLAAILDSQELRFVRTGCGIQSAFANTNRDLLSSSIYNLNSTSFSSAEDEYGTLEIHCEECGSTYLRTSGKLEKNCRHCGGTKGIVC